MCTMFLDLDGGSLNYPVIAPGNRPVPDLFLLRDLDLSLQPES